MLLVLKSSRDRLTVYVLKNVMHMSMIHDLFIIQDFTFSDGSGSLDINQYDTANSRHRE